MEYFVRQLINGLIAVGYTMVYGIIGMINFAHGDVFSDHDFLGQYAVSRYLRR